MVDKSSFLGCFNPCKFGFQNFSVNQVRPTGFELFEQAFPNDMGECEECKTRFSFLRRKKHCHYCGLDYCSSCLTRFAGGQRQCKKCKILNCWPINKADISSLRVRDLRHFLSTCKIPTNTYREKQELIDLVIVQLKLRHSRLSHEYQRHFSSRQPTNNAATSSTIQDDGIRVRPQSTNFEVPLPTTSNFGSSGDDFEATNHNTTGVWAFPSGQDQAVTPTDLQSNSHQEQSDISTSSLNLSNLQPEDLQLSSSSESLNQSGDADNISTNIPPDNEEYILQVDFPSESGPSEEMVEQNNDIQMTDTPASESKMACVADIIKLSTLSNEDAIKELSVRQCKEVLTLHRVDFSGVWEKHELVNKVIMLWKDFKERQGEKDWSEDQLCKICMDAAIDCVLLECGHMLSCTNCGKQMAECPVCRQNVVRVLKTFRA